MVLPQDTLILTCQLILPPFDAFPGGGIQGPAGPGLLLRGPGLLLRDVAVLRLRLLAPKLAGDRLLYSDM